MRIRWDPKGVPPRHARVRPSADSLAATRRLPLPAGSPTGRGRRATSSTGNEICQRTKAESRARSRLEFGPQRRTCDPTVRRHLALADRRTITSPRRIFSCACLRAAGPEPSRHPQTGVQRGRAPFSFRRMGRLASTAALSTALAGQGRQGGLPPAPAPGRTRSAT